MLRSSIISRLTCVNSKTENFVLGVRFGASLGRNEELTAVAFYVINQERAHSLLFGVPVGLKTFTLPGL